MTATLSQIQVDALQELGNIGSGNAATSLSVLLSKPVDIEFTQVELCSIEEQVQYADTENRYCVVHGIVGKMEGFIWLTSNQEDREYIANIMACGMPIDPKMVIDEASNILCGSYLRALSDMLSLGIELLPPQSGSLQKYIEDHQNIKFDPNNIMSIKNSLKVDGKEIGCRINLAIDKPSLQQMFEKFGLC